MPRLSFHVLCLSEELFPSLPFTQIAGAGKNFPDESNPIGLVGGRIHAEHGDKEHRIIADFSKAKAPGNLGATLVQVMKITAICLHKTLGTGHERPIMITWTAPEGMSLADAKFPPEIKQTGAQAASFNHYEPLIFDDFP